MPFCSFCHEAAHIFFLTNDSIGEKDIAVKVHSLHTAIRNEPAHEIMVVIIQATSAGSGEPVSSEPSLFARMK